MITFFYKIVELLKVICKNSEKKEKKRTKRYNICNKCNKCDSVLTNKDVIYYGFDKTFCSEDCREYYIISYENII